MTVTEIKKKFIFVTVPLYFFRTPLFTQNSGTGTAGGGTPVTRRTRTDATDRTATSTTGSGSAAAGSETVTGGTVTTSSTSGTGINELFGSNDAFFDEKADVIQKTCKDSHENLIGAEKFPIAFNILYAYVKL